MQDNIPDYRRQLEELLSFGLPYDRLLIALVAFFQELRSALSEKVSDEETADFCLWLTDCMSEKAQARTTAERCQRMTSKLESLLRRCDSDEAMLRYIHRAASNCSIRGQGTFRRFARSFYKKTREALHKDSRFVSRYDDDGALFWGLAVWKKETESCRDLSPCHCNRAAELKAAKAFPLIQWPDNGHFASSGELANASHRTIAHEYFRFFATLRVLFDLLKLTGQFGAALVSETCLEASADETNPANPFERMVAQETLYGKNAARGEHLAEEFWKRLSLQQRSLLALYVIPKADGAKVKREMLREALGYHNDVTMMNHENALKQSLKEFMRQNDLTDAREDVVGFMCGLEKCCDDLKMACSRHSPSIVKED